MEDIKKDIKEEKIESKSNFVCPNCGSTSSLTINSTLGCSNCFFTYPQYFDYEKNY